MPIGYDRAGGEARNFLALVSPQHELLDIVDAILGAGGPWPAEYPLTAAGHIARERLFAGLALERIFMQAPGAAVGAAIGSG